MYTFESKVRFSETDVDQNMKLSSIVNYFQDCSTLQSASIGRGLEYLRARGKSWVLSSWQIVIDRYPAMGENICVETWPTGFEGIYGTRNFRLRTADGEMLAYANSIWVFMDIVKGRPCKPTEDEIRDYPVEQPMEMEYAPRKVAVPKELEEMASFTVFRSQLDTNHHMNNSQYVALAQEILPEDTNVKQVRVEYKKSAVYGDVIRAKSAKEEDRTVVVLADENDKVYAAVEFK